MAGGKKVEVNIWPELRHRRGSGFFRFKFLAF
jgi:hypothetical protein